MSIKTLRKRIALVAVSALGVGLLSVAPASAAAGDVTEESLWLATLNSTNGAPVVTNAGGDTAADRSVGFLALTNSAGTTQANGTGVLAGVTATAVALQSARLTFNTHSASRVGVTITGGTISTLGTEDAGGGASNATIGGNGNILVTSAAGKAVGFAVTPNAGATTLTVSATQGAAVTSVATAGSGTAIGTWVITLTATAATGDFSAARSIVGVTTAANAAALTSSIDADTGGVTAGNPLYIQVLGRNAYAQNLASGTYVATATNGATLAWGDRGAAIAAGSLSVATVTPDGTDQLRIDPASSLTTSTTTVTITHNGNPVTTKTLTFYGEAKTITIESVSSGRVLTAINVNNTATAYAIYSYRDSAGNRVPGAAATFDALSATSVIPTGSSAPRAPSASIQAAPNDNALANAQEAIIGAGRDGVFAFTCGATSATTTVSIQHTNAISLATIKAPVTIACNGGINTFTVSTDKASYAVGEIATITIDAKDSSGNAVSNDTTLTAGSVSVGGGDLTATIAGTEVFTAGKITLKAQMKTAGTFNTVVSLAGTTTGSATAKYSVTDGSISNAEVLASIVKLIAAINKQIRALQKSLRR